MKYTVEFSTKAAVSFETDTPMPIVIALVSVIPQWEEFSVKIANDNNDVFEMSMKKNVVWERNLTSAIKEYLNRELETA